MAVAFLYDTPEGTQERYDAVRAGLGLDEQNLPQGGLVHIAGPSPSGGWRVVEVWESEEDQQRFARETLGPALEAAGIVRAAPQTWPVHNLMKR